MIMKKAIAEFIGTFALVLIGCGTVVVGGMATGPTAITEVAIALAFGLSIVAMAYGIGQISGCHVNPAVSFGVFAAGRMTFEELLTYWVAQVAGALIAALVLYLILSGKASGWNGALGQTTWSEYSTLSAFVFEAIGSFLFLVCILGVTQRGAPVELAGIVIGLTLAAIHLAGINISGSSVNPARSLGPAIVGFAHNPEALKQIWLYILAPLLGAGAAGYLFRVGMLSAETVIPVRGEGISDVPPAASAPRQDKPRRRKS
jgi:aquaporin Z